MMRAKIWIAAALCVVAVAGCRRSEGNGLPPPTGSGAAAPPVLPKVEAAPGSEPRAEPTGLVATGTTHPLHEAALAAKAAGPLSAVMVEEGDRVTKGQPLFRVDASAAGLQADQAKVNVTGAEFVLKAAEIELQRTKELANRGSISPAILEQAQLGYDRAKVGVDQAKVALASARQMVTDAVVTSPIDGVVTAKNRSVGETVVPGGEAVVVVHDLASIKARVRVPERAIGRVKAGAPVAVTFPALGVTRKAVVDRVGASIEASSRSVELVIVLPNEDRALKAGMLVEVALPAADAGDPDAGAASAAKGGSQP
jgi:RND family efflux transporter MFP subunit